MEMPDCFWQHQQYTSPETDVAIYVDLISLAMQFYYNNISHKASTFTFVSMFLYPPQRGYISFVNTFVTPRNNALGPYVPWRHLISAKF